MSKQAQRYAPRTRPAIRQHLASTELVTEISLRENNSQCRAAYAAMMARRRAQNASAAVLAVYREDVARYLVGAAL